MHLTREGGGPADDLGNAPLKVEWENLREPDYNPPQVIRLTKTGWMPEGIGDKAALDAMRKQNFDAIVARYRDLEFNDSDMREMLAVANGTFYNRKKPAEE